MLIRGREGGGSSNGFLAGSSIGFVIADAATDSDPKATATDWGTLVSFERSSVKTMTITGSLTGGIPLSSLDERCFV